MPIIEPYIERNAYTVTKDGILFDQYLIEYDIFAKRIKPILDAYKGNKKGQIRFSKEMATTTWFDGYNGQYTKINQHMPTAEMWYSALAAHGGWKIQNFGYYNNNNLTGGHSNANNFDNLLIVPDLEEAYGTQVYINYYDKKGNRLSQVPVTDPSQIKKILSTGIENTEPSKGSSDKYHEFYEFNKDESIIVRPKSSINYNSKIYNYVDYKIAYTEQGANIESNIDKLNSIVNNPTFQSRPGNQIVIDELGRVYMINLYYHH